MAKPVTTPPILQSVSHKPSAKERKYDRQLRLWAASGQQALENAKILLLNSGPGVVGVEILKNLILPGVGSFAIADEAVVKEEDLGVNFFLTDDSLGKSRAEECARWLQELNPEVEGKGVKRPLATFIPELTIISPTLILLVGPSPFLHTLSIYCSANSIPLIYVHSMGFYSHFSIQVPSQFPIVDTHPDPTSTQDLRLLTPWPELIQSVKKKTGKLEELPNHEHGHVPYLFLLLYYLEKWKAAHDGKPPRDYSQKKEFKALVEKGARTDNPEGGEENFEEAAAAVLKSLNPPSISSGLREVFESEDCKAPSVDSANFWITAHAIRNFHAEHGVLPLPGTLPDMKAQSADYIELQNIYKKKARQDLAEVTSTIRSAEQKLTRESPVDESEIEAFCKGAAFVKLIRGRPLRFAQLQDRTTSPGCIDWSGRASALAMHFHMPEDSLLPIYIAFLAYDHINLQDAETDSDTDADANANAPPTKGSFFARASTYAAQLLTQLAQQAAGGDEVDVQPLIGKTDDVLREFERAESGAELHNISALTGGMVAQEVIKVITKQYVPVDNACVFDGIASKSAVFNM